MQSGNDKLRHQAKNFIETLLVACNNEASPRIGNVDSGFVKRELHGHAAAVMNDSLLARRNIQGIQRPQLFVEGIKHCLVWLENPTIVGFLVKALPTGTVRSNKIGFAFGKHATAFIKRDAEMPWAFFGELEAASEYRAAKGEDGHQEIYAELGIHELNLGESGQNQK
jgi:hypothetical protein